MSYHYPTCDLLLGGDSSSIYRLNLSQGRFLTSYETQQSAINVSTINPYHQLLTFGGADGGIEFWDPRSKSRVATLDVGQQILAEDNHASPLSNGKSTQVTALNYNVESGNGLEFGVGTSTGHVLLYDLRSPLPFLVKDHQYGFEIKRLTFHQPLHSTSTCVISADTRIVKMWDKETGTPLTNIEPPASINDFMIYPDSGLLCVGTTDPQIQSYFLPVLGPAPKWCSFLENLTEEMEEDSLTGPNGNQVKIWQDFKFVTKSELESLSLSHLIGTSLLEAYMHGYFMSYKLYEKAKLIANPFQYQEYKEEQLQKKLDAKRGSRISLRSKNSFKVNQKLALKLAAGGKTSRLRDDESDEEAIMEEQIMEDMTNSKAQKVTGKDARLGKVNILTDDRFKDLFQDQDFAVDESIEEWRLKHPGELNKGIPDQFDDMEDSEEEEEEEYDSEDGGENNDNDDNQSQGSQETSQIAGKSRFFGLQPGATIPRSSSSLSNSSNSNVKSTSFGERISAMGRAPPIRGLQRRSGNMEVKFKSAYNRGSKRDDSIAQHSRDGKSRGDDSFQDSRSGESRGRGRGRGGGGRGGGRGSSIIRSSSGRGGSRGGSGGSRGGRGGRGGGGGDRGRGRGGGRGRGRGGSSRGRGGG